MALKRDMKPKRTAMTFRLLDDVRDRLLALSSYSELSYTEVIENLLNSEYERLEREDKRGLKAAEKELK